MIQVPPAFIIQIRVLSLAVEGPSPCLFDWLEVQEQMELSSVVTRSVVDAACSTSGLSAGGAEAPLFLNPRTVPRRFCGSVAPPTVNTNSSTVWVTFHSDGTIAGSGFTAQYRALEPGHSQYLKRTPNTR